MTRTIAALLCPLLALFAAVTAAQEKPRQRFELPRPGPDGKISIFNGKDLTGWYGDEQVWQVEDGELVGRSLKGLKQNNFLKSLFEVADFRLTFEVKLVPNTANSGFQFRSIPWQGHEMKGYQADIGQGWWGKLYEESARGLLAKPDGDKHVKKEDWNTYEIVAVGDRILIALNGQKTVDLTDPKGDKSGLLAPQVHSGGPTEVRFRNLQLELNPKPELATLKK